MKIQYKTVYGGRSLNSAFTVGVKCDTSNGVVDLVRQWLEKTEAVNPILVGKIDISVSNKGSHKVCAINRIGLTPAAKDMPLVFVEAL